MCHKVAVNLILLVKAKMTKAIWMTLGSCLWGSLVRAEQKEESYDYNDFSNKKSIRSCERKTKGQSVH